METKAAHLLVPGDVILTASDEWQTVKCVQHDGFDQTYVDTAEGGSMSVPNAQQFTVADRDGNWAESVGLDSGNDDDLALIEMFG